MEGFRHLDGFSPQHDEALRTLHQKSSELVAEDALDLIRLFDLDANSDRVHGGFDEDPLVFIS